MDPHIAAVDLGSHSFHMVVARIGEARRLTVVDRLKEPVRLAAGLDADRHLARGAVRRALDTLALFSERLAALGPERVRAVGTETWRRARNRDEVLPLARLALGHPIEIVSGTEEARLVYAGAATAFDQPGRRLVVDVGGASTELILGEDEEPRRLSSLHMGCVSWTRAHLAEGLDRDRLEAAVRAARLELGPVMRAYRDGGWDHALGTSGTVRTVEGLILDLGLADGLTREGLEALATHAVAGGDLPGLTARRRHALPGGLAVLLAVFRSLRLSRLTWVDGALKEGLLARMTGPVDPGDIRAASVDHLAERLEVDRAHAARVEARALALFDQAADPWGLDPRLRPLLGWAARLHEVGQMVSWTSYHKHGAYLIQHADLPGFSRSEQGLIAACVLSHRRRLSRERIRAHAPGQGEEAVRLAILLRLSATLHRTREDETAPPVRLVVEDRAVEVGYPEGHLDSRPLSRADLEAFGRALDQVGYALRVA